MNIPQLKIKYGSQLDEERRALFTEKNLGEYPSRAIVLEGTQKLRGLWAEINTGDQIIRKVTELTGISYPEDLYAYVIGGGYNGMSKPLLIPLTRRDGQFLNNEELTELLVHEMTHNVVGDQELLPQLKGYWDFVRVAYKEETMRAQNHIILYAAISLVFRSLFGEESIQRYIKPFSPDYKRAWEIVQEKGADSLLEEFRQKIG